MDDFKNMLILSYFFNYRRNYLLSHLQTILGLTTDQFEARISVLIERSFLEYKNNLLSITAKGVQIVLSKNIDSFPFDSINHTQIINSLKSCEALSLDAVYIPKKFMQKYGRLKK